MMRWECTEAKRESVQTNGAETGGMHADASRRECRVKKKQRNPLFKGTFIPDVEAHVFSDGKVYFYGSKDVAPDVWCSGEYEVFSSEDLQTINGHGTSFSLDKLPGNRAKYMCAPDCLERDGKYYLYICLEDDSEWVAEGETPWHFGKASRVEGARGIDPAVFMDEDGQAYYFWGQFALKGAKLTEDLKGIQRDSVVENILTQEEHFFHEGSSIRKRNGIYYLVFADVSRGKRTPYGGTPTCLGYATSENIFGPYTYRGVIIDNIGCDPQTWNNHGSIECIGGQWYVFYHRSTCGSRFLRRCCCEKIFFREDGSIGEVKMTSSGASDFLDAAAEMDASFFCYLRGNCFIDALSSPETLRNISHGDSAVIRYLSFDKNCRMILKGQGEADLKVTASDAAGCDQILFEGRISLHGQEETFAVAPLTGVYEIRFTFGRPQDFSLCKIKFEQ